MPGEFNTPYGTPGRNQVDDPVTPRRQDDSVIAVDVVLEPDETMTARARDVNTRLFTVYPDGFALDADHQPHITVLQRFVRGTDLDDLYAAANNVLASEEPTAWTLAASKAYYIPSPPIGLAGIVIEPTADLLRFAEADRRAGPLYCSSRNRRRLCEHAART